MLLAAGVFLVPFNLWVILACIFQGAGPCTVSETLHIIRLFVNHFVLEPAGAWRPLAKDNVGKTRSSGVVDVMETVSDK